MKPTLPQNGLLSQARDDSVIRVYLALFVVVHVPYFLPWFSYDQLATYSWFLATFFLQPVIIWALWPRAEETLDGNERTFWRLIAAGLSLWWVVSLINWLYMVDWFWLADLWSATLDVTTDFILLGYYLCWLNALTYTPHSPGTKSLERTDRRIMGAGAMVTAFCLFSYFILVPSRISPELFDTWVPSLLFFAGLDLILALLLVFLVVNATNARWRTLYLLLMIICFTFMVLDLLEAMDYTERFQWADSAASDLLWSVPYLLVIVFARARNFSFPGPAAPATEADLAKEHPLATVSPIILASFVLPVIHIGLDQLEIIPEHLRRIQGGVVLASLAVIWALAFFENQSLRRENRKAKAHRLELERLRVRQQVAERAEQLKGQFLANVSHEIRTPMNGILGMSEILLRSELDAEQRQHAELVRASARGLLEVIDDILEYSKFEAGELTFISEPFELVARKSEMLI